MHLGTLCTLERAGLMLAPPACATCLMLAPPARATCVPNRALGIGNLVRDEIRLGVAESTGLAPDAVLVSSTHTHCGPDLQGMWGGVTPSYRADVVRGAVLAVYNAVREKRPVDLEVSSLESGDTLSPWGAAALTLGDWTHTHVSKHV